MQTLTITRRDTGVARVTMSRPAVSIAFDEAMIAELDDAFAPLAEDDEVRVIVRAGEGKHFSAGADLKRMERASNASEAGGVRHVVTLRGALDAPYRGERYRGSPWLHRRAEQATCVGPWASRSWSSGSDDVVPLR